LNANPSPQPSAPSVAAREVQWTAALVGVALLAGFALQAFVPPGPKTLVSASVLAGAVVLALSFLAPGRLRETMAGFRFTSTLLVVLAVMAIAGTLVLQGESPASYVQKYGAAAGLILTLRLDDIFHGLPFALLMALFGAAVIGSATLRWPLKARNAGFFVCHLGLITSIGGAAASTLLSQRGMVWLPEGGQPATTVAVEKGSAKGQERPLGFQIALDRFDLLPYESEYRLGFYVAEVETQDGQQVQAIKLKTSFPTCDDGARCKRQDLARHVLPGGDSFRVKAFYPDFQQVATAARAESGPPALQVSVNGLEQWLADGDRVLSKDGTLAVAFGWARPAPVAGALTSVLVSGQERKILVSSLGETKELPLAAGATAAGGAVKVGELLEHATFATAPGTASLEWKKPAALVEWTAAGRTQEQLVSADAPVWLPLSAASALRFEKREGEAKAFTSYVTLARGETRESGVVSVNAPLSTFGWTFYQNSYQPPERAGRWVTGLEAVYDPGVPWVFTGFALICLGVAYMFYVEPRFRGRKVPVSQPGAAPAKAA
jgi:hypothetical protein